MAAYDLYLLIHPERWPSNDFGVLFADAALWELAELTGWPITGSAIDRGYGQAVMTAARQADQRLCLLDPSDLEILEDEADMAGIILSSDLRDWGDAPVSATLSLIEGVPLTGWQLATADARNVARVAARLVKTQLPAESRILIGGFARHDCVRRVAETLRRHHYRVTVCPDSCLPLYHLSATWSSPSNHVALAS